MRDESLPLPARRLALKRCVSAYAPFGYHETLGLLIRLHGPLDSPEAVLAALHTLDGSRRAWRAGMAELATLRRRLRRSGRRPPLPQVRHREFAAIGGWGWPGGLRRGDPLGRRPMTEAFLIRHGALTPQRVRAWHAARPAGAPQAPPQA